MANIWREPIFDRTGYDVAFALQQIAEWKRGHTHSTVVVEDDKVIINDGEGTVANDVAVLQANGATYVENDILVVQLGAVYDLKGCLNLSDITRIEDNISYIANRLHQYQYQYHNNVYSKEWVKESLPTALDMKRIADNIRAILNSFYTPDGVENISDIMLSYADINALEHNLYLVKQLLDTMENSFIKSSIHKCGATTRLPIRR